MNIVQKVKCLLGFHRKQKYCYVDKYPFRTTNKGHSKKRYYSMKVRVCVTYCEVCGKIIKRRFKRIKH